MKLSEQALKSLDRIEQLLEKHLPGQHNQMSHGGGGGASPDTGGNTSGGGAGGKPSAGSHSVKLPKNPKKLNMDVAAQALQQMGFDMKPLGFDMGKMEAQYAITDRSGKEQKLGSRALRDMIYQAAGKS
ncbi:MAG: hypothetical protein WC277_04665 [Bacilli bacterium]|jgi:hypothetical protein